MKKQQLKKKFEKIFIGATMNFFHEVFDKKGKPQEALTTSEVFSMEVIYSLGRPTVNQFARYLHLTSPNAAYKVNHLVQKGYLRKTQSQTDKRVYYLEPTEKYYSYYAINHSNVEQMFNRLSEELSDEEWTVFERILEIIEKDQARMADQPERAGRTSL
ncbi:MAG: MarR family transcriptional regulator [Eubacterium sp.]|nr:MarR family transcriptional regulator [Eubacterium sp.]